MPSCHRSPLSPWPWAELPVIEYIFNYPGMGYLLYQGIINSDYALIQGVVSVMILGIALAVLIIDLLYPLIDPRIRYGD